MGQSNDEESAQIKERKNRKKETPDLTSGKIAEIERLNDSLSIMSRRISRRQAISTAGKAAAAVAATAIIAGAAGYLGGGAGSGSKTVTETITATQSGAAAGPGIDYYYDPSLKGTTLNYLTAVSPEFSFVQKYVSIFTAETGIQVNMTQVPAPQNDTKAELAFASKSPAYDIIGADSFGAFAYGWMQSDYILDFNPLIAKTPSGWNKSDLLDVVVSSMTDEKGRMYAIPQFGAVDYPYFYRNDLLSASAVTFDDILADAQKTNNPPTVYGYTAGATPDIWSFFTWEMYLWGAGGQWYDPSNYHPLLNSDAAVEATTVLSKLGAYAPSFTSTDVVAAASNMAQGRAAQSTNFWAWYKGTILGQGSQVIGKIGYGPHPKKVSEPHMLASITFTISSFSKYQNAAWSFISFMTSPRIQQAAWNDGFGSAQRKSVVNNPASAAIDPDSLKVMGWLLNSAPAGSGKPVVAGAIQPHIPRSGDFVNIVASNLAKAFAGTSTPTDAMNSAQTQATAFMQQIGLYK